MTTISNAVVIVMLAALVTVVPQAAMQRRDQASLLTEATRPCAIETLRTVAAPEVGTTLVIDSMTPVAASPESVAFCRVRGHIHTSRSHAAAETDREIQIEVRLPEAWNRKYLQYGGGGTDGAIERAAVPLSTFGTDRPTGDVLARGYAIGATDSGHVGNGINLDWLRNPDGSVNRDRYRNYAFRARHLLAVSAKQMVAAYYGAAPARSYHGGTSNGGRSGLLAAQRFPNDFDGIIVHSPAGSQPGMVAAYVRIMKAQYPKDGTTPVVPAAGPGSLLPLLARITMTKCDAADGIADSIISDPAACDFDLRRDLPVCANEGPSAECFTPEHLSVLHTLYTPSAEYPRFLPNYQSDVVAGMAPRLFGPAGQAALGYPSQMYGFTDQVLKYWVYNDPARTIQNAQVAEFSRGYPSGLDPAEFLADSPDLSAFRQRGGRLLITQGLADPLVSPLATEAYYKRVVERMGGIDNTIEFTRLFMIPGQGHNTPVIEGVPSNFDWLTVLERWVEEKVAPDHLLGSARGMTRPICRYPLKARLIDPAGPFRDAASFRCQ